MSTLVKLRRRETSTPWGFRMNGGAEQGQPLYIQKVTANSVSMRAGLQPGDALLQIGHSSTTGMRHDQAKMEIIRSGNELDFIVQRGVVPVGGPDDKVPGSPRAEVSTDPNPAWRGIPPQNPNVQSRSFKILQQQLASE